MPLRLNFIFGEKKDGQFRRADVLVCARGLPDTPPEVHTLTLDTSHYPVVRG